MKTFKKLLAVTLALLMLLSLTACHGKDEIALTIEGVDITTALYLNALLDSDTAAKQRVDEQIAQQAEDGDAAVSEETDYFAQTIDGLSYTDYVKAEALKLCKEFAFYEKLVSDGTIKLEDDEIANTKASAEQYWTGYSYGVLYEPNGVSLETFQDVMIYSAYANAYFQYVYGEGGEKEVTKEELKKEMNDKYATAYVLSASYEENATDDQKAALKTKLEGFGKRLQKGEDYLTIYNELNGTSEKAPEKGENDPKDVYASILADESTKTDYSTADFAEVYETEIGEFIIIENEAKTGLTLYLKKDINSDDYYLTNLTDTILVSLKQEEFEKMVDQKTADFKVEENSWAMGRLEVENLDYSDWEALMAAYQSQQAAY